MSESYCAAADREGARRRDIELVWTFVQEPTEKKRARCSTSSEETPVKKHAPGAEKAPAASAPAVSAPHQAADTKSGDSLEEKAADPGAEPDRADASSHCTLSQETLRLPGGSPKPEDSQ